MGDTTKTVYITMIRDPVDIFVSEWDYYKLDGNYKMTLGKNHGKVFRQKALSFAGIHCVLMRIAAVVLTI